MGATGSQVGGDAETGHGVGLLQNGRGRDDDGSAVFFDASEAEIQILVGRGKIHEKMVGDTGSQGESGFLAITSRPQENDPLRIDLEFDDTLDLGGGVALAEENTKLAHVVARDRNTETQPSGFERWKLLAQAGGLFSGAVPELHPLGALAIDDHRGDIGIRIGNLPGFGRSLADLPDLRAGMGQ